MRRHLGSATSTDWKPILVTEIPVERHLDETAAGYVVPRELELEASSLGSESQAKSEKTSSKGPPIRTKALDPPVRRRHTSHHEGGLSRYGNSVSTEYVDSATETMATGVDDTGLGSQGDRSEETRDREALPEKLMKQDKISGVSGKSSSLMARIANFRFGRR